ncbi:hypothetical protein I7I50_02080 [Histoplasma capsulatum G186AR]|uniref:Uncharacterized protein n=1 Tax=Ajellomyces capsulatus TaxID=5037 RepID=A0A8H7YFN5_AJECA|nr:hypothetical protein I7I52_12294 [Histoplasma capsulatum]QSS71295.1 hypothetical protein I7I50_02080 [Histoplasma capsulatum G186AR]
MLRCTDWLYHTLCMSGNSEPSVGKYPMAFLVGVSVFLSAASSIKCSVCLNSSITSCCSNPLFDLGLPIHLYQMLRQTLHITNE